MYSHDRAAHMPVRIVRSRTCLHGPHDARGACAMAHNSVGSYGVMLLALAIVVLGIVVLAITWRRGRAGAYRARTSDEQGS
jgi:hypothetical protein